jgi:hypothetical protein
MPDALYAVMKARVAERDTGSVISTGASRCTRQSATSAGFGPRVHVFASNTSCKRSHEMSVCNKGSLSTLVIALATWVGCWIEEHGGYGVRLSGRRGDGGRAGMYAPSPQRRYRRQLSMRPIGRRDFVLEVRYDSRRSRRDPNLVSGNRKWKNERGYIAEKNHL